MILYHCSPVYFHKFKENEQGTHLGSLVSALQAGERKACLEKQSVYLYRVFLDIDSKDIVDYSTDEGHDWSYGISVLKKLDKKVLSYRNLYEPCQGLSYLCIDVEKLKILSCSKIAYSDLEQKLNEIIGE